MTDPAVSSEEHLRYPIGKFRWPEQVEPQQRAEWVASIRRLPSLLAEEVSGWSDEELDHAYRRGGWTVRQVVHHLADSHLNSYARYRLALTEDNPPVRGYDQQAWAELADARTGAIAPSLAMLAGIHARWAALLEELSEAEWARTFEHSERGTMRLDATTGLYAWHGEHHLAHIRQVRPQKPAA